MIRVVIERRLKPDKKGDLMHLLRELRTTAMHEPGYITGESLSSTEDDSVVTVLSTWRSLKDWKAWEKTKSRTRLYQQIESLLAEKPKVAVYEVMATEEKQAG